MESTTQSHSGRKKLASKRKQISATEKEALVEAVCIKMMKGKCTTGQALKTLRVELFSVNQEQYARMVGVTRKTLSEIEGDKSKAGVMVINQVLKGVGLSLMVIPRSLSQQQSLFNEWLNG